MRVYYLLQDMDGDQDCMNEQHTERESLKMIWEVKVKILFFLEW